MPLSLSPKYHTLAYVNIINREYVPVLLVAHVTSTEKCSVAGFQSPKIDKWTLATSDAASGSDLDQLKV